MDAAQTTKLAEDEWEAALPALQEFVRIPNLTPLRDAEWQTNGLFDKAVDHVATWIRAQELNNCTVEVLSDPGFSPFLFVEIGGTAGSAKASSTFVMYGHLDKQPWGEGWRDDIPPDGGVIRDGKLYGRGSADDGYAAFLCIIAVKILQRQGVDHPRIVFIAETSEESGSIHLGHYVERLAPKIGEPSAVFCMDGIIEDFNTFWLCTSLRGGIMASLEVGVLERAVHSGNFGGLVPDCHRIVRQLLARVEDVNTGRVLLPELFTKVPIERTLQMQALADSVGRPDVNRLTPWVEGAGPADCADILGMYRANAWEPSLAVIGQEGLPPFSKCSPTLSSSLKVMLAVRIPPLVDSQVASQALKAALERDPPCGAAVKCDVAYSMPGWNAPEVKPNLDAAITSASRAVFDGRDPGCVGVGGTIPLMKMLTDMFPEASMIVSGLCGPGCNEHGPNESMPIGYAKRLTACLAMVLGTFVPDGGAWPDDVPRPGAAAARKKPTYCFNNPKMIIGQCLCCM